MADRSQSKITRSLRTEGFWTFKAQDAVWTKGFKGGSKLALPEEPGKADLIVARNRMAIFIEVKSGDMSFAFSEWRDNQREWADLMKRDFNMDYGLAITMGVHPPHYNPDRFSPERSWVLTREAFERTEAIVSMHQASIPYRAGPGYSRMIQQLELDAVRLWAPYEVFWGGGVYRFKDNHWLIRYFKGDET